MKNCCFFLSLNKVNMVLNVHRNHEAYYLGTGRMWGRGYGGGEERDYIPIATL